MEVREEQLAEGGIDCTGLEWRDAGGRESEETCCLLSAFAELTTLATLSAGEKATG